MRELTLPNFDVPLDDAMDDMEPDEPIESDDLDDSEGAMSDMEEQAQQLLDDIAAGDVKSLALTLKEILKGRS